MVPLTVVWEAEPRQHLRLRTEAARERGQAQNTFLEKKITMSGCDCRSTLRFYTFTAKFSIFPFTLNSDLNEVVCRMENWRRTVLFRNFLEIGEGKYCA